MSVPKVYFADLRAKISQNLLKKLELLINRTGILRIDFHKKFTAIKIHSGEPGNLSYIRPDIPARIVKLLKEKVLIPFLTDCNTLYYGQRSNTPSHLEVACENGFNPLATDCPVIIGDGIRGNDFTEILPDIDYCSSAKIGSSIAAADIILSINRFKGHEMTGFGGALKNHGMCRYLQQANFI